MVTKLASLFVSFLLCGLTLAAESPTVPVAGQAVEAFPVKDLRPGMKAVGYTVFEGKEVEAFAVEILGVLKNVWGPGQHIILARLGDRVEKTGVAAGMSGSPVYLDGKLVGAVSLRVGVFAHEPIAGITPAELMLEIKELDESKGPGATLTAGTAGQEVPLSAELEALLKPGPVSGPSPGAFLVPIETPLAFTGFHDEVLQQFTDVFRRFGVTPVQGGAGSALRDPEPISDPEALKRALPPGGAVSGVLISGDLSVAGTGTVTYNDGHRVLAFGHPFFNFGRIEMPMATADVVTVLGSDFMSFKIVNTKQVVGALRQDRHSGILGVLGQTAKMIPVETTVRAGDRSRTYRFHVFQNARFTPVLMMLAFFNTLYRTNAYGEEVTYRVNGSIQLDGFPDVKLNNLYPNSGGRGRMRGPMGLSAWISRRFSRIFNNPFETPKISGVKVDFEVIPERRTAAIEHVWVQKNEVRPGETLDLKVFLRPYRGDRMVKDARVTIPATTPKGNLRILFSDADVVNRSQRMLLSRNRMVGLTQLISMMNQEHANGWLYITLLGPGRTVFVQDNVLPSLPSSVANVIDPRRTQNRLTLRTGSSLHQQAIPVDYVISGSQTVVVRVK
jgi:hypothetical protein